MHDRIIIFTFPKNYSRLLLTRLNCCTERLDIENNMLIKLGCLLLRRLSPIQVIRGDYVTRFHFIILMYGNYKAMQSLKLRYGMYNKHRSVAQHPSLPMTQRCTDAS